MLERAIERPLQAPRLTMGEARAGAWAHDRDMRILLDWVESYLMSSHPQLGRTGAVCPFTKQAARLDTVRVAISHATAADEEEAFSLLGTCFDDLENIPCKPGMEHFRTVIVGFPDCAGPDGVAMLQRVQRRYKFHSLRRLRMIGFMHDAMDAPGLWNPDFRPLRAPIPVLALRHLVEQDAPFAARHPLLMIPYLIRFRLAGLKRLREYRRQAG
jgi:hypothetical protein